MQGNKPHILRYSLDEMIAHGGQGQVWRGTDQRLNRTVAIKILNIQQIGSERAENFRRRFRREGCLTAALEHPNIVRLYDFGQTEEDLPYMVMEYVDGTTLTKYIQESHPIPFDVLLPYVKQMVDALDYAHGKGMIHRDLKPDNVMIDRQDRVRVMDFGLARMVQDDDSFGVESWRMLERGVVMGSPGFMAPEQAFGRVVDERADIFALGMMTYTMIAGRHPFSGDSQTVVVKTAKESAPAFSTFGREVPADLEAAIRKAIELKPENRSTSARDWWTAVRAAARNIPMY
jgi:serine/threonine-protein kinase